MRSWDCGRPRRPSRGPNRWWMHGRAARRLPRHRRAGAETEWEKGNWEVEVARTERGMGEDL